MRCADCNNFAAFCQYLHGGTAVSPEQKVCRYGNKFVPKFQPVQRNNKASMKRKLQTRRAA